MQKNLFFVLAIAIATGSTGVMQAASGAAANAMGAGIASRTPSAVAPKTAAASARPRRGSLGDVPSSAPMSKVGLVIANRTTRFYNWTGATRPVKYFNGSALGKWAAKPKNSTQVKAVKLTVGTITVAGIAVAANAWYKKNKAAKAKAAAEKLAAANAQPVVPAPLASPKAA
jgi:hypothetical protein